MGKKLLIYSMHTSGGCFQYSNEIIDKLNCEKEVWISKKVLEKSILTNTHSLPFWGYPSILRLISLALYLVYIYVGAKMGRFSGLLLCGFTSWDYYIMRIWHHTGLPSFFIVHDGKMHTGEKSNIYQNQLVQIMQWSTHLIFLSEHVHNMVKDCFNIDKPYIIAPHGLIDYGTLPKIKRSDKPTLLFLGRITKYKGVELLLDAVKNIPEHIYDKLIIAGKWAYEPPTDYNHDKVEIIDRWLSNDEILHYIAQSDIMVFPYIEATQSGVATLAINYLRPSVVTRVGAFSEQFNPRAAIMVEPTVEDIAIGIIQLCSDKSLYKLLLESLEEDKYRYSWDTISSNLLLDINKIISK